MGREEFLCKPKFKYIKIYIFIILSFGKVEASNISEAKLNLNFSHF